MDGFGINDILNKYPQFEAYDRKTIYNTIGRYRRAAERTREDRGNLKFGCEYMKP